MPDTPDLLTDGVQPTPQAAPTPPALQPLPGDREYDSFIPTLINNIQQAHGDLGEYLTTMRLRRALYEDQPLDFEPFKGCCDISVPYLKDVIRALTAYVVPLLCDPQPFFTVEGENKESKAYADGLQNHLDYQLRHVLEEWRRTVEAAVICSYRDGGAWAYVPWKEGYTWRRRWEETAKGTLKMGKPVAELTYYGPEVKILELEYAGTYPTTSSVQSAQGAYVRYDVWGSDLAAGLEADEPFYDEETVEFLKTWNSDTVKEASEDKEKHVTDSSASGTQLRDWTDQVYNLTDIYWRIGGEEWLLIVHEGSQRVLRGEPTPWVSGLRPLELIHAFGMGKSERGESVADVARWTQTWITNLLRMMADGSLYAMFPELLAADTLGQEQIDKIRDQREPLAVIGVNPDVLANGLKPLTSGVHPATIIPIVQQLQVRGDEATGTNQMMQNQKIPGQKTAHEVEQIMSSGSNIIRLQIQHLGDAFARIGNLMLWLNYQFMTHPESQKQWAQANQEGLAAYQQAADQQQQREAQAVAKAVEGAMQTGQSPQLPPEQPPPPNHYDMRAAYALVPDKQFALACNGQVQEANRSKRAQLAAAKVQMLDGNPMLQRIIGADGHLAYQFFANVWRDLFNAKRPEDEIGTEEQWVEIFGTLDETAKMQAVARMVQMANAKHLSGAVGAGGGQAPPQQSPAGGQA